MDNILNNQLFRFLIAGGVAAAANFTSRIAFSLFTSYEIAIVLAYLTGMFVAFVLMRGAVFKAASGGIGRQIGWFCLINFLAVIQTLLISVLFARWILPAIGVVEHAELVAHAIGVAIPVITSYIGHRLFTFRIGGTPE